MRTATRSAADIDEVGWPEPAAVLQRIESTRSCCPSWRANSRSVVASASVVTVISLPRDPQITGPPACIALSLIGLRFSPWIPPRSIKRDGILARTRPFCAKGAELMGWVGEPSRLAHLLGVSRTPHIPVALRVKPFSLEEALRAGLTKSSLDR